MIVQAPIGRGDSELSTFQYHLTWKNLKEETNVPRGNNFLCIKSPQGWCPGLSYACTYDTLLSMDQKPVQELENYHSSLLHWASQLSSFTLETVWNWRTINCVAPQLATQPSIWERSLISPFRTHGLPGSNTIYTLRVIKINVLCAIYLNYIESFLVGTPATIVSLKLKNSGSGGKAV